jgi:hypothetical protein
MARKLVRRPKRISASAAADGLRATLDQEFRDEMATRSLPKPDDRRGRQRYAESLRRLALSRLTVSAPSAQSELNPDAAYQLAPAGFTVRDLTSLGRGKLTMSLMPAIRLGDGLYDYFPPDLPHHSLWHSQPFENAFPHAVSDPPNGALLLTVPQIGVGRFYASASTLQSKTSTFAHAWSGVILPIDPHIHDAAHGPKEVVVWAEGTMAYDYALSAPVVPAWNTQPLAAKATVNVMARLLRYKLTGERETDPDAVLARMSDVGFVDATLLPNGMTTSLPSSARPSVGGGYAAWSSQPTNFNLDATHQRPRILDADHTYQIAVVCAVSLSAWGVGQGPSAVAASVQVSAQAFLRLVTLGIFELDSSAV